MEGNYEYDDSNRLREAYQAAREARENKPTRTWPCEKCGRTVERYRGMDDVSCECGAWYNTFGQRLRDDWMNNPSNYDENISDMDGYEMERARRWDY